MDLQIWHRHVKDIIGHLLPASLIFLDAIHTEGENSTLKPVIIFSGGRVTVNVCPIVIA